MTRIRTSMSGNKSNPKTIDSFLRFMGLSCQGESQAKGNKGRGAAQRRMKFLGTVLVILVCVLGVLHLIFPSHPTYNVKRHATKIAGNFRKRPLPAMRSGKKFDHHEQMDLIMQGKLNLVDITADRGRLARNPNKHTYEGVTGVFCQLNFDVHKKDPSGVPMFRDLVAKSPACQEDYDENNPKHNQQGADVPAGRIYMDLKEIAEMARKSDDNNVYPGAKNLRLTGVAFHESRCGSTLVANALIAMNPTKHRVYSESAPPITALNLCARALDEEETDDGDEEESDSPCTIGQGAQILRDVMYLMGRSNDAQEERYFFKIQSAGTRALPIFRRAFPTTPWIFVYRDPVQVMMSHFAQGKRSAVCLRSMSHPPLLLQKLAQKRGYYARGAKPDDEQAGDDEQELQELSPPGFCAAHLATLTETAAKHIQQSDKVGQAVNYVNLPGILYEKILPSWGVDVSQQEISNIQAVSGVYSKGRGEKKGEWHEDSQKKEQMASPEIQQASKLFLQESYERLEELSRK